MDSNMPAGRVWCFTLLFLSYIIFTTSIVTQDPVLACVGDTITVSCDLTVPNPGDSFLSFITDFIVGSSVDISDTIVNGNGMQGDVDLSKLTADSPFGSTENVLGTLTLLSYTLADNGLTLGCTNEYIVNGNSSNRASLTETINIQQANLPSPPVPLSADFDSTTCSGSVEVSWTAGASDRPIETYFLYLNGVDIASISSAMNSYSHAITLQIDTDYDYSVLAMSCAGNSTLATADTITIGVPSSPVVTLSQPNTNCTNILISWNTPNSDRDITEYSVYRNNTLLTTTTDNQYTDTDQLTINTVYEYSVTAISCAGSSTGTNTLSIGGYSLTNTPQLFISYNNITSILTVDWTLLPVLTPPPLLLEYSLDLYYNHTQSDTTDQFSNSSTFSLLSSITVYDTYITPHEFSPADGVVTNITACIRITLQCGASTGQTICRFYNSENPPLPPTTPTASVTSVNVTTATPTAADQVLPIIIGVVGAVGGILLIFFIVLFFIMLYICCIRNRVKITDTQSVHNYEDLDNQIIMSPAKQTLESLYTPMNPVPANQVPIQPPTYANLK